MLTVASAEKDANQLKLSYIAGGKENSTTTMKKQLGSFL